MWWLVTNREPNGDSWRSTVRPNGDVQWLLAARERVAPHAAVVDIAARLQAEAARAPEDAEVPAVLLLFIHGYNSSFEAAARRTELLDEALRARDPAFRGVVVGYSWPSASDVAAYWGDRDKVRASVPGFLGDLDGLVRVGWELPTGHRLAFSTLAHSMGNEVLLQGMSAYRDRPLPSWPNQLFTDALLVAADSDWDVLLPGAPGFALLQSTLRVSVYHSTFDSALRLSMKLAGNRERLGFKGPAALLAAGPDADRVARAKYLGCTVAVDCGAWARGRPNRPQGRGGHGAYFREAALLADMNATLIGGGDRSTIPGRQERGNPDIARFRILGDANGGIPGTPLPEDEPGEFRIA